MMKIKKTNYENETNYEDEKNNEPIKAYSEISISNLHFDNGENDTILWKTKIKNEIENIYFDIEWKDHGYGADTGQIYLNIYRNDKPLKSWSIFGIADYKLKKQTKAIIISKKKEFDLSIIEKDDILEIKGYVGSGNGHSLEIKTFVCKLNDEDTRACVRQTDVVINMNNEYNEKQKEYQIERQKTLIKKQKEKERKETMKQATMNHIKFAKANVIQANQRQNYFINKEYMNTMAGDQIETTKKGKTETIINKYSTVSTVCNDDEDEKNKKGKTHTIEPLVYSPVSHQDVRDDENKNGQIYLNIYRKKNDKPFKSWLIFEIADNKLKKETKMISISNKQEFDLDIIEKGDIFEIKGHVGNGNNDDMKEMNNSDNDLSDNQVKEMGNQRYQQIPQDSQTFNQNGIMIEMELQNKVQG
eukprot:315851_1